MRVESSKLEAVGDLSRLSTHSTLNFPDARRSHSLRIKNLALVEDLEWELAPGFTAITGETGAGKSIIIGALQLLLGERADKSLIRTGAETCTVEAVFEGADLRKLNSQLKRAGVEPCQGELIIKRSFSAAGANRQFVNGSPTTLCGAESVWATSWWICTGRTIINRFFRLSRQLELARCIRAGRRTVRADRQRYRKLQLLRSPSRRPLSTAETAREQEIDLLRHQVNEITAAKFDR